MKFISGLFKEDNGKPSWSRITATAIVLCTLVWVSFVVFKEGKLPDFSGVTLFLSGGVAATYGANKIATVIGSKQ